MKKKLAMLLMAMSLVMTACGGNTEADAENDSQVESMEENSEEESEEESTSEGEAEESTEAASDEQETVAYAFGTYTDTGYENASLGYRFTTPEGCVVANEQEILSLAGITMDTLSEDYTDAMIEYAKQAIVYDLYAVYPTTNTNVNIVVQNIDTTGITMDYLVETTKSQLETLTTMDVTVAPETEVATIAGKEYTLMKTVTVTNEITMTQELYLAVEEGRLLNITITYLDGNEAEAEALLAAFSAL